MRCVLAGPFDLVETFSLSESVVAVLLLRLQVQMENSQCLEQPFYYRNFFHVGSWRVYSSTWLPAAAYCLCLCVCVFLCTRKSEEPQIFCLCAQGLASLFRSEGLRGCFAGVGARTLFHSGSLFMTFLFMQTARNVYSRYCEA